MRGHVQSAQLSMLSNPSSCAGRTVRPNKWKRRRLEQRKVYSKGHARMGSLCSKDLNSLMVFREEFV